MEELKFAGSALLCPKCGGTCLHHEIVDTYMRTTEDSPQTMHTCVEGTRTSVAQVPSASTCNPSRRRDGVVIRFWCESCRQESHLGIAQHKGSTLVEWE